MANREVDTEICLPPGVLPRAMVREILRLVFEELRWFAPGRYGSSSMKHIALPGEMGVDGMLAYYEEHRTLFIGNRSMREFIFLHPGRHVDYPFVGGLSWTTREAPVAKQAWRKAHVRAVARLMKVLNSPLAYAALHEDIHGKRYRVVPREVGLEEVVTVNDYGEGLAGLYWRNFFGPPFVRMFGERLRSLSPDVRTDVSDELVLVESYPLPKDADTEEGKARERALIEQLGPECFYDHQRHELPKRRPDPADLPAPIGILLPPLPKAGEV